MNLDSNGSASAGPTASQTQKLWRFKVHYAATEQKWQHFMRNEMIDLSSTNLRGKAR